MNNNFKLPKLKQLEKEVAKSAKAVRKSKAVQAVGEGCDLLATVFGLANDAVKGLVHGKEHFKARRDARLNAANEELKRELVARQIEPKEIEDEHLQRAFVEGVALESDEDMRSFWVSLLASSMADKFDSRMVAKTLEKLTPSSAKLLAQLRRSYFECVKANGNAAAPMGWALFSSTNVPAAEHDNSIVGVVWFDKQNGLSLTPKPPEQVSVEAIEYLSSINMIELVVGTSKRIMLKSFEDQRNPNRIEIKKTLGTEDPVIYIHGQMYPALSKHVLNPNDAMKAEKEKSECN